MPNDLTASPDLHALMLAMGERARAAARSLAPANPIKAASEDQIFSLREFAGSAAREA